MMREHMQLTDGWVAFSDRLQATFRRDPLPPSQVVQEQQQEAVVAAVAAAVAAIRRRHRTM